MLKKRLIPVLFLKGGWIVRSESFKQHQIIGDPVGHVERMVDWNVDELVVINISSGADGFQHQRPDLKNKPVKNLGDFIQLISSNCGIPLTFGGGVYSIEDIAKIISCGADKVLVNKMFHDHPEKIIEAAKRFGSQAIVLSVDYKFVDDDYFVFTHHGKLNSGKSLSSVLQMAEDNGIGEVLINSIENDGCAKGYDLLATEKAMESCSRPIITCGGAGHQMHFSECFTKTNVNAIAAGNIFHFSENAYPRAKEYLQRKGIPVRQA